MRSFREKNVIYTEIQVLRLNKNFETDLKNIGNQGDYIVDCFGGIETFFKLSANKAHYDYIVDCFGGIETMVTPLTVMAAARLHCRLLRRY